MDDPVDSRKRPLVLDQLIPPLPPSLAAIASTPVIALPLTPVVAASTASLESTTFAPPPEKKFRASPDPKNTISTSDIGNTATPTAAGNSNNSNSNSNSKNAGVLNAVSTPNSVTLASNTTPNSHVAEASRDPSSISSGGGSINSITIAPSSNSNSNNTTYVNGHPAADSAAPSSSNSTNSPSSFPPFSIQGEPDLSRPTYTTTPANKLTYNTSSSRNNYYNNNNTVPGISTATEIAANTNLSVSMSSHPFSPHSSSSQPKSTYAFIDFNTLHPSEISNSKPLLINTGEFNKSEFAGGPSKNFSLAQSSHRLLGPQNLSSRGLGASATSSPVPPQFPTSTVSALERPTTSFNSATTPASDNVPVSIPVSIPNTPTAIPPTMMTPSLHKALLSAMRAVRRLRDAANFNEPVDHVKFGIPDYPLIIKSPMDLSTIENKLVNYVYESVDSVVSDFLLMVKNCFTYNGRDAAISGMADRLRVAFGRHLIKFAPTVASSNFPDVAFSQASSDSVSKSGSARSSAARSRRVSTSRSSAAGKSGSTPNTLKSTHHQSNMSPYQFSGDSQKTISHPSSAVENTLANSFSAQVSAGSTPASIISGAAMGSQKTGVHSLSSANAISPNLGSNIGFHAGRNRGSAATRHFGSKTTESNSNLNLVAHAGHVISPAAKTAPATSLATVTGIAASVNSLASSGAVLSGSSGPQHSKSQKGVGSSNLQQIQQRQGIQSNSTHTQGGVQPRKATSIGPKVREELAYALQIVNEFFSQEYLHITEPFLNPVDRKQYKDYSDYVSKPMDFGTVHDKLENNIYQSTTELESDVSLIFSNCTAYNPVGHIMRQWASQIENIWKSKWENRRSIIGRGSHSSHSNLGGSAAASTGSATAVASLGIPNTSHLSRHSSFLSSSVGKSNNTAMGSSKYSKLAVTTSHAGSSGVTPLAKASTRSRALGPATSSLMSLGHDYENNGSAMNTTGSASNSAVSGGALNTHGFSTNKFNGNHNTMHAVPSSPSLAAALGATANALESLSHIKANEICESDFGALITSVEGQIDVLRKTVSILKTHFAQKPNSRTPMRSTSHADATNTPATTATTILNYVAGQQPFTQSNGSRRQLSNVAARSAATAAASRQPTVGAITSRAGGTNAGRAKAIINNNNNNTSSAAASNNGTNLIGTTATTPTTSTLGASGQHGMQAKSRGGATAALQKGPAVVSPATTALPSKINTNSTIHTSGPLSAATTPAVAVSSPSAIPPNSAASVGAQPRYQEQHVSSASALSTAITPVSGTGSQSGQPVVTYAMKLEVSLKIGTLGLDKLQQALAIIQESMSTDCPPGKDEIEIEFAKLDDLTMYRLWQLVSNEKMPPQEEKTLTSANQNSNNNNNPKSPAQVTAVSSAPALPSFAQTTRTIASASATAAEANAGVGSNISTPSTSELARRQQQQQQQRPSHMHPNQRQPQQFRGPRSLANTTHNSSDDEAWDMGSDSGSGSDD